MLLWLHSEFEPFTELMRCIHCDSNINHAYGLSSWRHAQ